MVKAIVTGVGGRMGSRILALTAETEGIEVVGAVIQQQAHPDFVQRRGESLHHGLRGLGKGIAPAVVGAVGEHSDAFEEGGQFGEAKAGEHAFQPGAVGAGVALSREFTIGEIGAPGAGDQQLAPDGRGAVDQRHLRAAARGEQRRGHAGRPCADDGEILCHTVSVQQVRSAHGAGDAHVILWERASI